MKALVAGLGSIGRRHTRNLRDLGVDDLVLYHTGHSTMSLDEFEGLTWESELDAALAHRPDAVIICNPSSLHMSVAIPAIRAGAHLLIEKPLSNNLMQVEELQAALTESTAKVQVGFQYRFHPGLQTVKQLLEDERIGRALSARAEYAEYLPDWHPWEDYRNSYAARAELGGGVVLTLCHPFDYLRWLFGEVEAVTSETWNSGELELEVEEGAEVILQFGNTLMASVHLSYNRRPPAQSLEIVGSAGLLRWDYFGGQVACWTADTSSWEHYADPPDFERNMMFMEELRQFIEVVGGTAEPACTLDDGIEALRISLAALKSAEHGSRQILIRDLVEEG